MIDFNYFVNEDFILSKSNLIVIFNMQIDIYISYLLDKKMIFEIIEYIKERNSHKINFG